MFGLFSAKEPKRNGGSKGHNGQALIDLTGLEKAYRTPAGDFYALKGIDLRIQPGEFVSVAGKSGAGKSTLINMVTGIDKPTAGQVRVGPHAVHEMSENQIAAWRGLNVGVIFQFFQLLPMLTCAQNVMLPMDFANVYRSPRERRERALYLLDQVGIPEQADKLPHGLQRTLGVAIGLAAGPKILLLDEPLTGMNPQEAMEMIETIRQIRDRTGTTVVIVEHNMRAVMALCERIVVINFGTKIAEGTPEEIQQNEAVIEAYLGSGDDDA